MHVEGTTPGLARRRLSPGRELALVSVLYLLLTVVLTYPVFLRVTTHIVGEGDAPVMVWDLWAMTRAILDPQVPLSTTDLIFHPLPDVANIWISPASVFLSLPLTLTCGHVCTYNLVFLSSSVLAGVFCYLLVRYLGANKLASFVAGCIFSFSSFHYAQGTAHWGLFLIQWLPLFVLCLLRLHSSPSPGRALQFAVASWMVILTFPYFGAYFVAPLLSCFFVYQLCKDRSAVLRPQFLGAVALALGVTGSGLLLFYHQVIVPEGGMAAALAASAKDAERYSADLLAYVTPSARHPVFGDATSAIYDNFSADGHLEEATVYLGIGAPLLAFWGLWRRRGQDGALWAILALLAFILSLGPVLRVNGRALFPLPYALLMRLPLFGSLRAPSRMSVTLLMFVSVLAGHGFSDVLDRVHSGARVRVLLAGAVVLFVCFETLFSWPFPSSSAEVPAFYDRLLAESHGQALFQLPSGSAHTDSTGWYMYYQTQHHRDLAIGYQSREPLPVVLFPNWLLGARFLSPPVSLPPTDTWPAFEASLGSLLAYNDIRYVVLQRQAGPAARPYTEEEYLEVKASLTRSLGEGFYKDNGLAAYEVAPLAAQPRASFEGKLELVDRRIVEATSCPDDASRCTFLVTFWRAVVSEPEVYGLHTEIQGRDTDEVLARTAHNMGYQFSQGEEVGIYNTSWWSPGVVVTDYTLLPAAGSEGEALPRPADIWVRVTDPGQKRTVQGWSARYPVDGQGRLLVGSYCP
jgi:hypothetical protein